MHGHEVALPIHDWNNLYNASHSKYLPSKLRNTLHVILDIQFSRRCQRWFYVMPFGWNYIFVRAFHRPTLIGTARNLCLSICGCIYYREENSYEYQEIYPIRHTRLEFMQIWRTYSWEPKWLSEKTFSPITGKTYFLNEISPIKGVISKMHLDLMQIWRLLISIHLLNFMKQSNEPHHEKDHV